MDDKWGQLRAQRDELESWLLALEQAVEAQRPVQGWQGVPQELAERATELLRQLGTVNDRRVTMGVGPASKQP